jgi:RNA-splicing ligase RtcB
VYAEALEATAEAQIQRFLDCPAFEGSTIRIMPDVHAGAGAVIGFTATVTDRVVPNVIGVDIGCGVQAHPLARPVVHFDAFDALVRESVPCGFAVHDGYDATDARMVGLAFQDCARAGLIGRDPGELPEWVAEVSALAEHVGVKPARVWPSLGTLGGGNHFVEIGQEPSGQQWLVVHSGSRNLGLRVAVYHQRKAQETRGEWGDLAWLEGDGAAAYLRDMRLAQEYAAVNRALMLARIVPLGTFDAAELVTSVHNYIGADGVVRKGAISAKAGERVIIPWNMRDGIVIGTGLGAADWNNSAPHGAGRVMGRKQAKRELDAGAFVESMRAAGVWTSSANAETLDEAPEAYKRPADILAQLGPTVTVETTLRPVYNFKASKPVDEG